MILQIIDIMRALDYIQGSSLTPDEKRQVAAELRKALPAPMLCSSAQNTHAIADARLGAICDAPVRTDGRTTEAPRKAEEDRPKGHQQPGLRKVADGKPRDAGPSYGGAKKVARG